MTALCCHLLTNMQGLTSTCSPNSCVTHDVQGRRLILKVLREAAVLLSWAATMFMAYRFFNPAQGTCSSEDTAARRGPCIICDPDVWAAVNKTLVMLTVWAVYGLLCAKVMAAYLHDRIEALAVQNPSEAEEIRSWHSSVPRT